MLYTKSPKETLKFEECVQLLETMIGNGLLDTDPENSENVLIYYSGDVNYPEGWYSRNLFSVASDLVTDIKGQELFRTSLEQLNIPLEFNCVTPNTISMN